jgi:hypothetical protein
VETMLRLGIFLDFDSDLLPPPCVIGSVSGRLKRCPAYDPMACLSGVHSLTGCHCSFRHNTGKATWSGTMTRLPLSRGQAGTSSVLRTAQCSKGLRRCRSMQHQAVWLHKHESCKRVNTRTQTWPCTRTRTCKPTCTCARTRTRTATPTLTIQPKFGVEMMAGSLSSIVFFNLDNHGKVHFYSLHWSLFGTYTVVGCSPLLVNLNILIDRRSKTS